MRTKQTKKTIITSNPDLAIIYNRDSEQINILKKAQDIASSVETESQILQDAINNQNKLKQDMHTIEIADESTTRTIKNTKDLKYAIQEEIKRSKKNLINFNKPTTIKASAASISNPIIDLGPIKTVPIEPNKINIQDEIKHFRLIAGNIVNAAKSTSLKDSHNIRMSAIMEADEIIGASKHEASIIKESSMDEAERIIAASQKVSDSNIKQALADNNKQISEDIISMIKHNYMDNIEAFNKLVTSELKEEIETNRQDTNFIKQKTILEIDAIKESANEDITQLKIKTYREIQDSKILVQKEMADFKQKAREEANTIRQEAIDDAKKTKEAAYHNIDLLKKEIQDDMALFREQKTKEIKHLESHRESFLNEYDETIKNMTLNLEKKKEQYQEKLDHIKSEYTKNKESLSKQLLEFKKSNSEQNKIFDEQSDSIHNEHDSQINKMKTQLKLDRDTYRDQYIKKIALLKINFNKHLNKKEQQYRHILRQKQDLINSSQDILKKKTDEITQYFSNKVNERKKHYETIIQSEESNYKSLLATLNEKKSDIKNRVNNLMSSLD